MKFILLKDLIYNNPLGDSIVIAQKDSIVEPNEDGFYTFQYSKKLYTIEDLLKKPEIFKELKDIDIDVSEISMDEDEVIKNWRIQVDVKTSFKKLKKIESALKEYVQKLV